MNTAEFENKLRSLPEEAPDKLDLAMLADAEQMNDDTTADLETVRAASQLFDSSHGESLEILCSDGS